MFIALASVLNSFKSLLKVIDIILFPTVIGNNYNQLKTFYSIYAFLIIRGKVSILSG